MSTSSGRSRRRSGNRVWPEPFVEAVAFQIAVDASRSIGRLAAAPALFNLFQVCRTWRAVSDSGLLWQNLTRHVWNRDRLTHNTWREEYVYHHLTSNNFRIGRYVYTTLHFVPTDTNDNNTDTLSCRRMALSDQYLAAGFADGVVRLFHLASRLHLSTYYPHPRDRLGRFSRAVSGIVLSETHVVFASVDGDIHVADINAAPPPRRAHLGDVVNDGALVDFTGSNRWWVGLYAGVPDRAFHVWNSDTEELVFVGGAFTDPEAVMGWHLLAELTQLIGRVRITSHESAIACTGLRIMEFDLRNHLGLVLNEEPFPRGLIVGAVDANNDLFVIVDSRGRASVRRVRNFEEVCRFTVRGASQRGAFGCINAAGYAIMCIGGDIFRVWGIEQGGEYLYDLRERVQVHAMVADHRHIAACSSDATIHLWDFGPQ